MEDDYSWTHFKSTLTRHVDATSDLEIVEKEDLTTPSPAKIGRTTWTIGRSIIVRSNTTAKSFQPFFDTLPPVFHSMLFVNPIVLEDGEVLVELSPMRDWLNFDKTDTLTSIDIPWHPTLTEKEIELEKTISDLEYYNGSIVEWDGNTQSEITSVTDSQITLRIPKDLLASRFASESVLLPQQSSMWLYLSGVCGESDNYVNLYFEQPDDFLINENNRLNTSNSRSSSMKGLVSHLRYDCPYCEENAMVANRFVGAVSLHCTSCWNTDFISRKEVDLYLGTSELSLQQLSTKLPQVARDSQEGSINELRDPFPYDLVETEYKYTNNDTTVYLEFTDSETERGGEDGIIAHTYTGAIHFSFPVPNGDIVDRKDFDKPAVCQLCASYIKNDEKYIPAHDSLGINLSENTLYHSGSGTEICFDCFESLQPAIEAILIKYKERVLTHTV